MQAERFALKITDNLEPIMNTLDEMDRVFQLEIETLINVRENLNDAYAEAVEILFRCSGKVIVTGVGKSGLIGQKIASTMISTGTPAFYLHPSDAMHGDMGIIKNGDVLLVISKSGESEEFLSILNYVRNIGVPAVSITANPTSTLQRNSDLVLITPVIQEACPLNLAPTSSTTAALVVGDALDRAIGDADGRVMVASFASLISRIQQVINAAVKHGRHMAVVGRSMVDNVDMAFKMGYLSAPTGLMLPIQQIKTLPPNKVVIMTTGSQGEPTSALVRMANKDHKEIQIHYQYVP